MAFADVEAKTTFTGFSAADEATILGAMETAYNGSAIAKTMFDNYIATPSNTIDIQFSAGDFAASAGTGKLFLDLAFLTDNNYITPTGKAVEDTAVTGIVHELGHALTGRRDNYNNVDYKGDNVNFVNTIYTQLGLPEQLSYIAYDSTGTILERNFQYTNGVAIDRAVSLDGNWNSSPAGNSKDLLIGGPSANTLQSGPGDDFLWGAGGDDNLNGGTGTDTVGFKGKPTDYDIRLNPDGTWTSRHVRGAANEGTDTLTNLEKVVFEGAQTFDLKKKGLTFQTDFALVIDTTGSMVDDIAAVKTSANTIINTLFAGNTTDARIGIVGFKDNTIGEPTSIILPFTDQDQFADRKAAALTAINGITVSGGGDLPETSFDGLLKALDGTMGDWRPGAGVLRVALFTDAAAKDGALAATVATLAANIGATITSSSRAVGSGGTLDTFTFAPLTDSSFSQRDLSVNPDAEPLPPFIPADDPPTPDTSVANLEIYTIFTGNFGSLDPDLADIASTTGGSSFEAPNPEDLVEVLLEIIELPPENTPPIAEDDNFTTNQDIAFTGSVLADNGNGPDSDPDGDALTVTEVVVNDSTITLGTETVLASGAKLTVESDGTFDYNPDGNGDIIDTFSYTISDGKGGTDEATVSIAVGITTEFGNGKDNNETGTAGDDVLLGGNSKDTLLGGAGNDILDGGNGADNLTGGLDNDTLTGGNGPDTFILAEGEGTDTITDFTVSDLIGLSGGIGFSDLSLSGSDIILRSTNEVLAILTGVDSTTLTSTDFTIV